MSDSQKGLNWGQVEQLFIEVSKMFKEKHYSLAAKSMTQLIALVELQLSSKSSERTKNNMKKTLSECYLNKAVCFSCQEEGDNQIMDMLEQAIKWDHLNFWAYFNLYSLHFQSFNYRQALNNLKCALSCLYLTKAVLSKDLQSKNSEKDLGKALGLCSNNIEAKLVKLIMLINQNRWKIAINEIESLQQLLIQKALLETLLHTIKPCDISADTDESLNRYVVLESTKLILTLKQKVIFPRLSAQSDIQEEEELIKVLNDRLYEYNELLRQVNQLGYVFGVFHYGPIATQDYIHMKVVMISNMISPKNLTMKEKQSSSNQQEQSQIGIDYSLKLFQGLNSIHNNSVSKDESLFDYTKSNNYIETSKGELIGNLLSSMGGAVSRQIQDISQNNGNTLSVEGMMVGNMQKKGVDIRVIQSQIHPFDESEPSFPPQKSSSSPQQKAKKNSYQDDEDEQFLLDSAFNKSSTVSKKSSKEQSDIVNSSRRSKQAQKKTRIYPVKEQFKFIQIYLSEMEFKDNNEKLIDLYCDIEVKCSTSKTYKFTSKRQSAKAVGVKSKVEWFQDLGFVAIPEDPATLEVRLMRSQKDKFFDSCLGKGQIEMTSAGLNKFPIYSGAKLIGLTSITLILSEECLNNSYKQSNISSSNKTNSIASIRLSGDN